MNKLLFGDNLHVLRERINPESVDLVYLDRRSIRTRTTMYFFARMVELLPKRKQKRSGIHGSGVNTLLKHTKT